MHGNSEKAAFDRAISLDKSFQKSYDKRDFSKLTTPRRNLNVNVSFQVPQDKVKLVTQLVSNILDYQG